VKTNRLGSARLEERLNARGRKLGARPEHWKKTSDGDVVTDARIAQQRLRGLSAEEIAEKVGMTLSPVFFRLRRMGFPRRARFFLHGEVITGRTFTALVNDFGLNAEQGAERVGLSVDWATRLMKGKGEWLSPRIARRIVKAREELLREFRRKPAPGEHGVGRPRKLTAADESEIRRRYDLLRSDLKTLRHRIQEEERRLSKDDLWDWLCREFRAGHLESLQFCPQFFAWAEKIYDDLAFRSGDWVPRDLAIQFLAHDYDVSEEKIAYILSHAPEELH
jgi:transcriptional regulator with XRE-family HTH domain